jgi:hypothetical protein
MYELVTKEEFDPHEWLLVLSSHAPITLFDNHEVELSIDLLNNIYSELLSKRGDNNIYFLPSDSDYERHSKYEHFKRSLPYPNINSHIIGKLTDVKKNVFNYLSPTDHIYVKISIDKEYDWINVKEYALHIGINHVKFEQYPTPIPYNHRFKIQSCDIKGLYFKPLDNPNHTDKTPLRIYYLQMGLDLKILMPGRAYY